jgi:hypothetical protein
MRANEFINPNLLLELAPVITALGSALARGAAQSAIQTATQLGNTIVSTSGNIQPIKSGSTPTQTTSTAQTSTLQPNQLRQLKGKSIPTDLGQTKVGNINQQGLELTVDPNSRLGKIVGNKVTLPLK